MQIRLPTTVYLHAQPDVHSRKTALVGHGARVEALGRDAGGQWVRVRYKDAEGWLYGMWARGADVNALPVFEEEGP